MLYQWMICSGKMKPLLKGATNKQRKFGRLTSVIRANGRKA